MSMIKNGAAILLGLAALGPTWATAQTVTKDKPYVPKFVRAEEENVLLNRQFCTMDYPKISLRHEEQGETFVNVVVASDGRVLSSKISRSSGHRALDAATLAGLPNCRFRPWLIDGKPVQSGAAISFKWVLQ